MRRLFLLLLKRSGQTGNTGFGSQESCQKIEMGMKKKIFSGC